MSWAIQKNKLNKKIASYFKITKIKNKYLAISPVIVILEVFTSHYLNLFLHFQDINNED